MSEAAIGARIAGVAPRVAAAATALCAHCGLPIAHGGRFCCPGCAAAYQTILQLGLGRYYADRALDPTARPPRPDAGEQIDFTRAVTTDAKGRHELVVAVDGLQCGACVWLIESALARESELAAARVNMTTRRLRLAWEGPVELADRFAGIVARLGYRLVPYNVQALSAAEDRTGKTLIRALAVAGFAASNVMLSSVAIWAGLVQGMGPATRELLHWVSALVAMPAIAYSGMIFFRPAFAALCHGRTNMDVPISIGVILVTAMSLVETAEGGEHAYFDSAISLIFFLLIGRVLDHLARGRARAAAAQLVTLRASDVAIVEPSGVIVRRPAEAAVPGNLVLVAQGERIGVDGVVEQGEGQIDTSLVTGEGLPVTVGPGTQVFAGTVNLGAALTLRTTATGAATLLAECVRLIEAAESRRGRFVVLADRVARRYAPMVHLAASLTFLFWWLGMGAPASQALLTACAVLIITCPCALALAVPAVQVIATGRLFRHGILLKSATALERLAGIDTVVFDKTGTLTEPMLALVRDPAIEDAALVAAAGSAAVADGVREIPGKGLEAGGVRLGSREFAGDVDAPPAEGPEMWLSRPGQAPLRFRFDERVRVDAAATIARLRAIGLRVLVASGDRAGPVGRLAGQLSVTEWLAGQTPTDKIALVERLRAEGHAVLMVGDGLNDGPSLAAATVSASPSTAADISQTVADFVFQGSGLAPVAETIVTARRARSVMRQNIGFSIVYNAVMVPLAIAGWVTPWLAAAAMSSSSLVVIVNSFRLRARRRRPAGGPS